MDRRRRLAGIAAGFALATLAAMFAASGVWRTGVLAAASRASTDLISIRDLLAGAATFGVFAAVPAVLARREMRGAKAFRFGWAAIAITVAATGPVALAFYLTLWNGTGWPATRGSPVFTLSLFSIPRLVLSPVALVSFALSAVHSPAGQARRAFQAACIVEGAVIAGALIQFVATAWRIASGPAD
jgi:hypothetical protein